MNSGFILGECRLDGSLGIRARLSYPTLSFMESEIAVLRQMDRVKQPRPSTGGVQMESNICRTRRCIRLRPRGSSVKNISTANKNRVGRHIDHQRMGRSTDLLQPPFIVCSAQYMAEWPNMHWERLSTRGNKSGRAKSTCGCWRGQSFLPAPTVSKSLLPVLGNDRPSELSSRHSSRSANASSTRSFA
jgi:hypothetical protein